MGSGRPDRRRAATRRLPALLPSRPTKSRTPPRRRVVPKAGATGLEPATSAVTGQRSNLLSYAPAMLGAPGRRAVHDQYAKAERPAPPPRKLADRPALG